MSGSKLAFFCFFFFLATQAQGDQMSLWKKIAQNAQILQKSPRMWPKTLSVKPSAQP
jgi:hypothetical protein